VVRHGFWAENYETGKGMIYFLFIPFRGSCHVHGEAYEGQVWDVDHGYHDIIVIGY